MRSQHVQTATRLLRQRGLPSSRSAAGLLVRPARPPPVARPFEALKRLFGQQNIYGSLRHRATAFPKWTASKPIPKLRLDALSI